MSLKEGILSIRATRSVIFFRGGVQICHSYRSSLHNIIKKVRKSSNFKSGRNRTRTCDPIDVNDVLSALRSFVRERDD